MIAVFMRTVLDCTKHVVANHFTVFPSVIFCRNPGPATNAVGIKRLRLCEKNLFSINRFDFFVNEPMGVGGIRFLAGFI